MQFLYRSHRPTLDLLCHQADLSRAWSEVATKRTETDMRMLKVVHERRTAGRMSRKSLRALVLVSGLLAISLAVNVSIILLGSAGL